VSKERLLGSEKRWRRRGEPVPAGHATNPDGTLDYGVFGPGSVAWEVLLHPAVTFFQTVAQANLQFTYKPIFAGIRDWDPISRKARDGELTLFDVFDRAQRNSGIHTPLWLGTTDTAQRVAKHLENIHRKVAAEIIDAGEPELGGYEANSPRETLWAALTEMHSMLWIYENLAFRDDGSPPRRLSAPERDQYMAEVASYCRLFSSREDEIPTTMAELQALYEKYDDLFRYSKTIDLIPATGQHFHALGVRIAMRNFHITQLRPAMVIAIVNGFYYFPVWGAMSGKTRTNQGFGRVRNALSLASLAAMRPFIKAAQGPRVEAKMMRLLWGPDAVVLIESARELHRAAEHGRLGVCPGAHS
jgi:uncharacterized protein (DUF2236 family)